MYIEDPLKMIIYSPPGHGKTTFLGTAAGDDRVSPMLLLEFEAGTKAIQSKIRKLKLEELGVVPPDVNLIDVVSIKTWADFDAAYDFLANYDHQYRSAALDSLSEMNYLNMAESLSQALREDKRHDPDIMEQRDYLRSASDEKTCTILPRFAFAYVFYCACRSPQRSHVS